MISSFHNPLPGVPLVESPLFDEVISELELDEATKAAAQQLHHQGWAVLDFPEQNRPHDAESV
jgi:hypothetical protein